MAIGSNPIVPRSLGTVNSKPRKTASIAAKKMVSTLTLVDSADGKTLTITTTGKDAKGQNIDSVAVYDKQ